MDVCAGLGVSRQHTCDGHLPLSTSAQLLAGCPQNSELLQIRVISSRLPAPQVFKLRAREVLAISPRVPLPPRSLQTCFRASPLREPQGRGPDAVR